jgi:hypothetical protein
MNRNPTTPASRSIVSLHRKMFDLLHLSTTARRATAAVVAGPRAEAWPAQASLGDDDDERGALRRSDLAWRVAIACCCAAGGVVLAWDYSYAARHPTNATVYGTFWVGFLVVLLPCAARLAARTTPRGERIGLIAVLGLLNFLPKYLRTPHGPLFHDELLNWRQAEVIHQLGTPFQPSAAPILKSYPGLHLLTDMLHRLTGLPMWTAASILIACVHVALLVGVFLLGERLFASAYVGGLAALLYSLNPSLTFFDSQYSYESLAILFFVWALVAAAQIHGARGRRARRQWVAAGVLIGLGCIVTHHVTTYSLLIVLVLCAVGTALVARGGGVGSTRAGRRALWLFLALLAATTTAWFVLMASQTYDYISFHVDAGFTQVAGLLEHGRGNHRLFQQSAVPLYETAAAFLTPLIAAVAALAGLRRLWRARGAPPLALGLCAFGLLYFASLPFMLSLGGNEGARRSWGFTYLGLAVLVAPVLAALTGRVGFRRTGRSLLWMAGFLVAVAVVQVGNVAAGVNETYRFPGPYVYGSDTRSRTPEAASAARWMERSQGRGQRVITDRYMGLTFFALGHQDTVRIVSSSPIWRLYLERQPPSPDLLAELARDGYRYLVVDRRSTTALPREGIYFEPSEPEAFARRRPVARAAVEKFRRLPWATQLYGSDHLDVYRLDYGAAQAQAAPAIAEPAP